MIAPFAPESFTPVAGRAAAIQDVAGPLQVLPPERRPDAPVPAKRPAAERKDGGGGSHGPAASPNGGLGRLLSLLADPTRLQILRILANGERPVVGLTTELRLPQPTVSHHLAWLRMMDLVSPRRQGKHIFYSLGPTAHHAADGTLTVSSDDATVTIRPRADK